MKRTLFLVLTLVAATSASATIIQEKGINTLTGHEILTADTTISAKASPAYCDSVFSVGCYRGDGSLTLAENVHLQTANALMIGGKGYGVTSDVAGNGTVILNPGSVITVGVATQSSGGHHVDVGNSKAPCTGELYVNGGTVNTTQFTIGVTAAIGYVSVTNGGTINLTWDGVTPSADQVKHPDQVGMKIGYYGGSGTIVLDNGHVVDTTGKEPTTELQIGCAGNGHVSLKNGSDWTTEANVFIGDMTRFWGTAYGQGTENDTLDVDSGSSFAGNLLMGMEAAVVTNAGTMSFEEGTYLYGTTMTNSGTLHTGELEVADKAAFTNSGEVNAEYVECSRGASMSNSGTIHADEIIVLTGTILENTGVMDAAYTGILGTSATNSGTMGAEAGVTEIYLGSLDNTGTIQGKAVVIGSESSLLTGTLVVSGCETAMHPEHEMQTSYATGIAEGTAVVLDPNGTKDPTNVTIGARVNGGDTMQYLYSKDFRDIDTKVKESLNLQVVTEHDKDGIASAWEALSAEHADKLNVKVANVIGDNISANVTTDDAHDGGDITVALSGSHLVVRVGDNGASDPTAEDKKVSAEKVGTLGSYQEDVAETDASVRLHTTAIQSTVEWEGHYMETVRGETSVVNDTTRVSVGSDGVEGTLTVVEKSTLQNRGDVTSDKMVVNGTLDNNGTVSAETTVNGTLKGSGVMAATTLAETATLIVGNSPGYSTFTDALMAQSGSTVVFSVSGVETPASLTAGTGWDSHTYSQIVMENNAPVTLCDGVNITIAIGGDVLCSSTTLLHEETLTPFELILIKGGVTPASADLVSLMNHTHFVLTDESGALPLVLTGQTWVIDVANAEYRVEGGNLILSGDLKVTRTPEPAAATLSLLALTALASRRRRK